MADGAPAWLPRDPTWRAAALCGPTRLCKPLSAWPAPQRHRPGPTMLPLPAALRPEKCFPRGPLPHTSVSASAALGVCSRAPHRSAAPHAAGVGLLFLRAVFAAVSDDLEHRQPHSAPPPPAETAWGLTRTRALKGHQDTSGSAALAPQEPTLPPPSGWPVSPGIPQRVCSPHPWTMEPGSKASGSKGGETRGQRGGSCLTCSSSPAGGADTWASTSSSRACVPGGRGTGYTTV